MNDIKFRAWDTEENKMIEDFTNYAGWMAFENMRNVWHDDRYIKLQYSGSKDKNKKEIYKGDIVRLSENVIYEGMLVECVFWKTGYYYQFITGEHKGKYTDMLDDWRKYEVIGNIYENKELLNERKSDELK